VHLVIIILYTFGNAPGVVKTNVESLLLLCKQTIVSKTRCHQIYILYLRLIIQ